MTCIKFTAFLLFLLLNLAHSEEPDPLFRAEGSNIEMGYCFGADYILVYRATPEGDHLLGNSSNKNLSNEDEDLQLLGLQITNLTHLHSGIYKRECWQNQTRTSQHTLQLIVCNEEMEPEEIIMKKKGEGTEVLCNSTSIGLEGTSVRWYSEMDPSYKPTLFLDTSLSLQPFGGSHPGVVQVRDNAARLILDDSVFDNNQHFYCLVIKGQKCLGFQNMYPPDNSQTKDMFFSPGETVVLFCPTGGDKQLWKTPQGSFNASNRGNSKMHIAVDDESEDFSLVIHSISEDLSGYYSCVSRSFEIHYTLTLCPQKISHKQVMREKETVSLRCSVDQTESQQVQWHRHQLTGQSEVLYDSHDDTHPIPEDLRGRMTVTEDSSLLTISDLHVTDSGLYWCIVLKSPEFLESVDDYTDDYTDEEDSDETFWPDSLKCISKQETNLVILKKGGRSTDYGTTGSEPPTPTDPPQASNIVAYAVGGGVLLLLVVGVIVAITVVKKKRATASPTQTQRQAASCSGAQMDTKLDPGCTDRLTNNDLA